MGGFAPKAQSRTTSPSPLGESDDETDGHHGVSIRSGPRSDTLQAVTTIYALTRESIAGRPRTNMTRSRHLIPEGQIMHSIVAEGLERIVHATVLGLREAAVMNFPGAFFQPDEWFTRVLAAVR